ARTRRRGAEPCRAGPARGLRRGVPRVRGRVRAPHGPPRALPRVRRGLPGVRGRVRGAADGARRRAALTCARPSPEPPRIAPEPFPGRTTSITSVRVMTSDAAPTPSRPTDPFAPPPPPPPAATGRMSLPRPPGPVARALTDAWRARALPVPRWTAAATAAVGVAGGWVLVGHRPGLGAALLGAALSLPAADSLRGRRPVDLVSVALAVALVAVVAVRDAAWVRSEEHTSELQSRE